MLFLLTRHSLVLHAGASLTLFDRARLSLTVPVSPYQEGERGVFDGIPLAAPSGGVGDVSVAGDVRVYGRHEGPLRIATGARVSLPTGARSEYLGDGVVGVEPRVMVSGSLNVFEYALQGGVLFRPDTEIATVRFTHEARFVAAAGVRFLDDKLLVGPEFLARAALASDTGNGGAEIALGAHYRAARGLDIGIGGGIGVVNAPGSPDQRGLLSVTWAPAARTAHALSPRPTPVSAPVPASEPAAEPAAAPEATPEPTHATVTTDAPQSEGSGEPDAIEERVQFAVDSSAILPTQTDALRLVLAVLRTHPDEVLSIRGHADETGSDLRNRELSEARARAVRDWLIAHGAPPSRIETVGYGSCKPRDPATTWTARAVNRRVEFSLLRAR